MDNSLFYSLLVFSCLLKESCRFVENAVQVMAGLGKCIQGFSDPELVKIAWEEFYGAHCPYREDRHSSKTHHWKVGIVLKRSRVI